MIAAAPLYRPTMPRTGKPLSVEMTNAGQLGWLSDKERGYQYRAVHPVTGRPWPPIPERLLQLWREVADYDALPEACLVNFYAPATKLGSHVDSDEADRKAPVVSVSIGADAVFHVGGQRRTDPKARLVLRSGDVVVLGGEARHCFHGIDRILPTVNGLIPDGCRLNLTLRRVTVPYEISGCTAAAR